MSDIQFSAAQEMRNTTGLNPVGWMSSAGGGGKAEGAWVDGVYYDVTWTIPYPLFDANRTMLQLDDLILDQQRLQEQIDNEQKTYYKWEEGVQYYKHTTNNDVGINTYIYLNMNGTWVDVTGRVTIVGTEHEYGPNYNYKGIIIDSKMVNYLDTGSHTNKDNEYNRFFAPGESRLLVISGKLDLRVDPRFPQATREGYIVNYLPLTR